ncbi:MAG: hypothetical protein Kow00121_21400 [Elainellaceae cyanobacterium]
MKTEQEGESADPFFCFGEGILRQGVRMPKIQEFHCVANYDYVAMIASTVDIMSA